MVAAFGAQLHGAAACQHLAVAEAEVAGEIVEQAVAAPLGLEAEHEGAVAIEVDAFDGVHLDRHLEGHGSVLPHEGQFNCRSEEHTSELQSLMRISYAVFCLKKKQHN